MAEAFLHLRAEGRCERSRSGENVQCAVQQYETDLRWNVTRQKRFSDGMKEKRLTLSPFPSQ